MTDYRHVEKAKRQAAHNAEADGGVWCVVKFPGYVVVRPERRALNLVRKHPECEVVATVKPEVTP